MIRPRATQAKTPSPDAPPPRAHRLRQGLCALLLLAPLLPLAASRPTAESIDRLAGLAPPRPPAAAAGAARFADDGFITDDGARLPLRRWLPRGRVKAVVLALHGFNDYSHAFAMPAKVWTKDGIATYAYDQRGFGGAPERGRWVGEGRLAVDAIFASRILRRAYPGVPLYLLGESMGGAVAIVAAAGAMRGVVPGPAGLPAADIDAVILSAPAVWGRETMDLLPKLALFAGVRLFPEMVLTGRGLNIKPSDNVAVLRQLARDPMVLKGARIDTIFGLVDLMDDAVAAAPRLALPLLLLYGAQDEIMPPVAVRDFTAHLPPDPAHHRRLAYYRHGYHLLLRDLDGAAVAGDVASWMLDPAASLPSGADAGETATPWPPRRPSAEAASMPPAPVDLRGRARGANQHPSAVDP